MGEKYGNPSVKQDA